MGHHSIRPKSFRQNCKVGQKIGSWSLRSGGQHSKWMLLWVLMLAASEIMRSKVFMHRWLIIRAKN